jgi:hypothetical protein
LDAEAIEAFNEFSFLKQAKDGSAKIKSTTPGKYATQPQQKESLDTMKERLWYGKREIKGKFNKMSS